MRRVARLACQLAALIAVAAPASCQPESLVLDVPYVHQVYDVPEWFDGRCSCGAACVVMVLAYYGVLPPWPCNCSEPFPHVSLYGCYVACRFRVGGFVFDERAPDATRVRYARGVHGFIYVPGVGASWGRIVRLFEIFGFNATVDSDPTWEELVRELREGRPVILSTDMTGSGHLVVAVGYAGEGVVVVNDPAGDISLGYFNYEGRRALYDWPGYDGGHPSLVRVKAMILVRPTPRLRRAEPLGECGGESAAGELLAVMAAYLISASAMLALWAADRRQRVVSS